MQYLRGLSQLIRQASDPLEHVEDSPSSQARTCLLVQREGFWPVASLFSCQYLVLQTRAPLPKAQQASQAVRLFQLAVDLLLIVPTSDGYGINVPTNLGLAYSMSQDAMDPFSIPDAAPASAPHLPDVP